MYKHILIPTDGTALSESAVDKGLAFAREIGAKVTVMMTIEPAPMMLMAMVQLTEQQHRYHQHASEHAARHLAEAIAKAKGCTTGQVALAWLLAQDSDIVPIPGTKRSARVDENAAATNVSLTADEVAKLSSALPPGAAAGGRYPDGGMKAVYI